MRKLTDLQRETLEWIRQYVRTNGIAPSRAEIAEGLGINHQSIVDQRLTVLERKNWIELKPGSPRYIKILNDDLPLIVAGVSLQENPSSPKNGSGTGSPGRWRNAFADSRTSSSGLRGIPWIGSAS